LVSGRVLHSFTVDDFVVAYAKLTIDEVAIILWIEHSALEFIACEGADRVR
jgi:hypothetical protein